EADMADSLSMVAGGEAALDGTGNPGRQSTTHQRKIIYTAAVDLLVKDFVAFEAEIAAVIATHAGFIAEQRTDRNHRDHQGGSWVIRVPVDRYDDLLKGVSALGFARSLTQTSDDVTEAYGKCQGDRALSPTNRCVGNASIDCCCYS
ncbi:DUF4349 domain-containing protein, partial [Stieleria sp. TO1_6]|uniref:DUF4349 domain-containing protein n=1 Tax=Stieleria tagensis TaxID=2956795 RepID=UPI00209A92CD